MKLILTLLAGLMLTPLLSGQQQIDAWKCIRSTKLVAYPEYQNFYTSPIVYESNIYKSCKQAGETLADTKARVNALANADVLAWVESWEEVYYPVSEWWSIDEGFYWNCNGQMAMSPYPEQEGYAYPESMSWEEIEALEEERFSSEPTLAGMDATFSESGSTNIGWKYRVTFIEYVESEDAWYTAASMETVCPSAAFPTTFDCELEAKRLVQVELDACDDVMSVTPVIDTAIACPGTPLEQEAKDGVQAELDAMDDVMAVNPIVDTIASYLGSP